MEALSINFFLEFFAVSSAVAYVLLAAKGDYRCFVFGLISSLIYVYLCFSLKFYFDVAINVYYVGMSFWGWFSWKAHNDSGETRIKKSSKKELLIWILTGLCLTLLLANLADRFSEASLPYLDAFTTIFAFIATWQVVQRKLENWLFWIVIDLVATGMYFYKELYLTSLLFLAYTIIAVFGYFSWQKKLQND